jgi:Mce-associated membrane protein
MITGAGSRRGAETLKRFVDLMKAKPKQEASTPGQDERGAAPDEPDAPNASLDHDGDLAADRDRDPGGSTVIGAESDRGALDYELHSATVGLDESALDDPADEPARHVTKTTTAGLRLAFVASTLIVAALGALIGYLGYHAYESRLATHQRELFLQAGRQAAIDLTTISYTQADADVARILDSATGSFHDEFQKRAQPFIDVVKQEQSTSVGSVTAAGLESVDGDRAQVIVAVSVKSSNAGVAEQQPRGWRMRVSVQKVGDAAKVSEVQFVS